MAMGFSYPAIAEMVGCSPDQVYRLVYKHDLKTPLSKSEVTLLGSWHNYRDLARRKTRSGVSNVAAAYLAERMTRIAQELRRTEAHIEKFKRGRDAGSPVSAADAVPLEALPDDELYARLEKLVGGLASADDGAGPVVGRTAGAEPDAVLC